MRKSFGAGVVMVVALIPLLAGCGHKLVAHNGATTVDMYANKEQFEKVESMKSQGGVGGLFAGIGQNLLAKKIDNDTPVKVLSTDNDGATVEILDGRNKGQQGYVAKDNVD
jgi:hypothetical protein